MRHGPLRVLSLALAGCASYGDWTKAGVTDEQLRRYRDECALEASAPRSPGAEKIRMNEELYNACLSAHHRQNTYVPPPVTNWRDWLTE